MSTLWKIQNLELVIAKSKNKLALHTAKPQAAQAQYQRTVEL